MPSLTPESSAAFGHTASTWDRFDFLLKRPNHHCKPRAAIMPPKPSQYPCLRCRLSRLSIGTQRRQFHAAGPNRARKAAYPNVKAADLGLLDPVAAVKSAVNTRPYTEKERNLLTRKYGREKMAIIDIGEEAVSAEDMEKQSLQRTDPMRIPYYDDFSTLRPIIDFPFEDGAQVPSKKEDRTGDGNKGLKAHDNEEQVDPHMRRLSQQTGLRPDIIKRLQVVDVVSHRVSNQTRMGKIPSLYRLTIAGDRNGMLGIGEGKAAEDDDARRQAMAAAVRNMRPIPRYEDRTIFGDVQGKVGASIVQLSSRPPGKQRKTEAHKITLTTMVRLWK